MTDPIEGSGEWVELVAKEAAEILDEVMAEMFEQLGSSGYIPFAPPPTIGEVLDMPPKEVATVLQGMMAVPEYRKEGLSHLRQVIERMAGDGGT
jgi:hypothetical protein